MLECFTDTEKMEEMKAHPEYFFEEVPTPVVSGKFDDSNCLIFDDKIAKEDSSHYLEER
jgi:hypothetical protein